MNSQNTDAYITPENALEWGLATAIGVPHLETRVVVQTRLVSQNTVPENTASDKAQSPESSPVKIPRPKGRKPRNAVSWDEDLGEWVMKKRKRSN